MTGFFPLAGGNRWVYKANNEDPNPLELSLEAPGLHDLEEFGRVEAWPLRHPFYSPAFLLAGLDRLALIGRTYVGPRGAPSMTIEAEYRFSGPPEWDFEYAGGGCVVTRVTARSRGLETVTVPAGTFECLRIDFSDGRNRRESHWLREGLGIVRMLEDEEDGLDLTLIEAHLSGAHG